jgi:hypothetical protein
LKSLKIWGAFDFTEKQLSAGGANSRSRKGKLTWTYLNGVWGHTGEVERAVTGKWTACIRVGYDAAISEAPAMTGTTDMNQGKSSLNVIHYNFKG